MEIALIILGVIFGVIILLFAVMAIRAVSLKPHKSKDAVFAPDKSDRAKSYGERLSKMIQKETVSDRFDSDRTKFYEFHKTLEDLFPLVHKNLTKNVFDGSLLFKWKGKNDKKPIMLMSHHDVVQAKGDWKYPSFSGHIDEDGRVWGRGTVDTKGSLFCIFQAVEELLSEGYTPETDVYIARSCTEEWSGGGGPAIASYLKENNVQLELLLDEGGMILEEPIKGVKGIYAMVGVVEKGYGDIKFIARGKGGHASAPPKNTPLVRLGKFMAYAEKHDPFKAKLTPTVTEMFKRIAPNMSFPLRLVFANLWITKPLLAKLLPSISPAAGAMTKTTLAFTKASGSEGLNVLPQEAYVTGNMRFIHHQPNEESIKIVSDMAKKFDIDTEIIYQDKPCPIVNYKSSAFALIEKVSADIYPDVLVSPYVMTGGTDCKFYSEVSRNSIRFAPLYIDPQQYGTIHGLNENVYSGALPKCVDFYKEVIKAEK